MFLNVLTKNRLTNNAVPTLFNNDILAKRASCDEADSSVDLSTPLEPVHTIPNRRFCRIGDLTVDFAIGFVTANRFRSYGKKTDSVYRGNVFIDIAFTRFDILTDSASFFVCASTESQLIQFNLINMDDISIEMLISLVEARPALWDKTLDSYKDKTSKESAWREICTILNEDFQALDQKERQNVGKSL
ncbi:hypothetical protein QTP88_010580 [Uroleucon formosanum]